MCVCCLSVWEACGGEQAEITFPFCTPQASLSATRSYRVRGASLLLTCCSYCSANQSDVLLILGFLDVFPASIALLKQTAGERVGAYSLLAQGDFCCRVLTVAVVIL